MTRLHSELEPLRRGALRNLYVADQQYAYARLTNRASVIVVINNAPQDAAVEFKVTPTNLPDGSVLVDRLGVNRDLLVRDQTLKVQMPPRSASIFAVR
jgi:hypothetical protein